MPEVPAPPTRPIGDTLAYDYLSPEGRKQVQFFHSYSGCDIRAMAFNPRSGRFEELANIQTLSYSIHREKYPVRTLGSTHARQYTRGPRTIAGSIIFTVFDTSVLGAFIGLNEKETEAGLWRPVTVDQIPPFHIVMLFASEYNVLSSMALYNVEVVNEGQVMSVEDLITENTCQYVATHLSPMRQVTQRTEHGVNLVARNFSELLRLPLYREVLMNRNPFDLESDLRHTMPQLWELSGGRILNG